MFGQRGRPYQSGYLFVLHYYDFENINCSMSFRSGSIPEVRGRVRPVGIRKYSRLCRDGVRNGIGDFADVLGIQLHSGSSHARATAFRQPRPTSGANKPITAAATFPITGRVTELSRPTVSSSEPSRAPTDRADVAVRQQQASNESLHIWTKSRHWDDDRIFGGTVIQI